MAMMQILQEEWQKATGRIPPTTATLYSRFHVNTNVNYSVINRAYLAFVRSRSQEKHFNTADVWWQSFKGEATDLVKKGYVQASKAHDSASNSSFGDPIVSETIKGMYVPWMSVMSKECLDDLLANNKLKLAELQKMRVSEVMSLAVTEMTGKLLWIYAFTSFHAEISPSKELCRRYITGSKSADPLNHFLFPRMFGDISDIKKEVVGNPLPDTSGMLLSLCLASASSEKANDFIERLKQGESLTSPESFNMLISQAMQGISARDLFQSIIDEDVLSISV